jgi:hypothetical protein
MRIFALRQTDRRINEVRALYIEWERIDRHSDTQAVQQLQLDCEQGSHHVDPCTVWWDLPGR